MLTLEISKDQLQTAFQTSLDDMLKPGNYSNPVKQQLDKMMGYSGSMQGVIGEKVKTFLETELESPEFQQVLGKSIAAEMAKRAVDALEKKK